MKLLIKLVLRITFESFEKSSFQESFCLIYLGAIVSRAIQGQVRVSNVEIGRRRKRRQTDAQKTLISTVLTNEFCNKIQDSLSSCTIQNIQFQNAEGLTGTFVNFVIVISVEATSESTVITRLNDANGALGTTEGLDFVPGVISGKWHILGYTVQKCRQLKKVDTTS